MWLNNVLFILNLVVNYSERAPSGQSNSTNQTTHYKGVAGTEASIFNLKATVGMDVVKQSSLPTDRKP